MLAQRGTEACCTAAAGGSAAAAAAAVAEGWRAGAEWRTAELVLQCLALLPVPLLAPLGDGVLLGPLAKVRCSVR